MKKGLILLLFLAVYFVKLVAQTSLVSKYSEIKIISNLDSLEKCIYTKNLDINQYFNSIATLEKSRVKLGSCKFGESLNLLDSLNKIINKDNTQQIFFSLKTQYKISTFVNKSEIIYDLNTVKTLSKKLNDSINYAHSLYNLIVQNVMGEAYEDAPLSVAAKLVVKKYYDEIIEITKNSQNPSLKLMECISKVEYFLSVDTSCDIVIKNAMDGLAITEKYFKNNIEEKNYFYTCLAASYNYKNNFDKALYYSKKCLSLHKTECSTLLAHNLFNIANCYFNVNEKSDSALKYYTKAIEVINNTFPKNLLLLEYCYDRLAVIKYYKENYKQAFEDLYNRDSLTIIRSEKEKSDLALELQHKYEFEKHTQKISTLQHQKKIYLFVLIGSLIFILFIIFLLYKIFKVNNKLTQLVNFRSKLISIISHDLRSPFYSLQGLNSELSYLIREEKYATLLDVASSIDEASLKITNLLNNLLLWASSDKIIANAKSSINLSEIFTKTIGLYSNMIDEKNINITMQFENLDTIASNKNIFELVIRNWLDNTIKYNNAKSITISSLKLNEFYIITISDNGIIDESIAKKIKEQLLNSNSILVESNMGLGLELIAYFTSLEKWKIEFNTIKNNDFTIYIPI